MKTFESNFPTNWVVILGELSYSGKKREQIAAEYNQKFGNDGWMKAHFFDGDIIDKSEAIALYEEGYFHFLRENPGILEWLVTTASDVYDISPSNVHSGLDYAIQECEANHFQDISVRRVLERLGRKFEGDHLVQIRGHESEGYVLNPGQVPFHKPEYILPGPAKTWWKPDSVEAFYQHNKALLIDPERLVVKPEIQTPDGTLIFHHTKQIYYHQTENPLILRMVRGKDARGQVELGSKNLRNNNFVPYSLLLQ